MNVLKYHNHQTQIADMICRLNDHTVKHFITQYRKHQIDMKWHTNMSNQLEQTTTILILTLLCSQPLQLLRDVFIFFYQKIRKINDTNQNTIYIYRYDIAINKNTWKCQKIHQKYNVKLKNSHLLQISPITHALLPM